VRSCCIPSPPRTLVLLSIFWIGPVPNGREWSPRLILSYVARSPLFSSVVIAPRFALSVRCIAASISPPSPFHLIQGRMHKLPSVISSIALSQNTLLIRRRLRLQPSKLFFRTLGSCPDGVPNPLGEPECAVISRPPPSRVEIPCKICERWIHNEVRYCSIESLAFERSGLCNIFERDRVVLVMTVCFCHFRRRNHRHSSATSLPVSFQYVQRQHTR
jgi:hypothetical protein